jgi:hypothetical protein
MSAISGRAAMENAVSVGAFQRTLSTGASRSGWTFKGTKLLINYSTSAVGSIKVEVQDQAGAAIPGFALTEATEIYGDEIERAVSWKHGTDVGRLAGRPTRLRFVMKDADLYSMCFRP